ncbi:pheromone-regulated protein PRM4 KNAG_0J01730 [Huiozyma naganishii CBS 8797]|uniref:RRM domain-containing protein n=1 Tax=Huiozyma naganishii (strain ATCC MYA-139 / BCRC 22969 / CBS 8797 / KCTC 17520 / NBRC 10181 / NCYC 3082 / Yp74L-3) TaxID=1071383 RepID=J7S9R3_HUIN7|nr:hypothetical protein KNAG_0J01730 [Kazachstania naganishii CBS 8797]CCK72254.1 hypothetical protein KNAG_0J01730 [Kazachstania naganishii CBS 8797]
MFPEFKGKFKQHLVLSLLFVVSVPWALPEGNTSVYITGTGGTLALDNVSLQFQQDPLEDELYFTREIIRLRDGMFPFLDLFAVTPIVLLVDSTDPRAVDLEKTFMQEYEVSPPLTVVNLNSYPESRELRLFLQLYYTQDIMDRSLAYLFINNHPSVGFVMFESYLSLAQFRKLRKAKGVYSEGRVVINKIALPSNF